MNTIPFVNQRVVRNDGGYTKGRTGTVIEVDVEKKVARVKWDNSPRTWLKFTSIDSIADNKVN